MKKNLKNVCIIQTKKSFKIKKKKGKMCTSESDVPTSR